MNGGGGRAGRAGDGACGGLRKRRHTHAILLVLSDPSRLYITYVCSVVPASCVGLMTHGLSFLKHFYDPTEGEMPVARDQWMAKSILIAVSESHALIWTSYAVHRNWERSCDCYQRGTLAGANLLFDN